ncbi:MAG: hypothetical protein M1812_007378 [Candelaria pacifica]|nr:MAG: hypothetical protein M1812_007378 [Candelaria pacifica]
MPSSWSTSDSNSSESGEVMSSPLTSISSPDSSRMRFKDGQAFEDEEIARRARYDNEIPDLVTFRAIAAAYRLESALCCVHRTIELYFDALCLFHDDRQDWNVVDERCLPTTPLHFRAMIITDIGAAKKAARKSVPSGEMLPLMKSTIWATLTECYSLSRKVEPGPKGRTSKKEIFDETNRWALAELRCIYEVIDKHREGFDKDTRMMEHTLGIFLPHRVLMSAPVQHGLI